MFDTLVIGNGPAGVSAAVYLKRYNIDVIVVGSGYGTLQTADKIENYYGIKSITGKELIDLGKEQCKYLNIPLIEEEVLSINMEEGFYKVKTNLNTYDAKSVLLATGKSKVKLKVANLAKFEGHGISYCATCDGFFYRKKKIALIGDSDFMFEELEVLEKFTKDITIFTNGKELSKETSFKVVTDKLESFEGEDFLKEIKTSNETFDVDGCFIATGSANALDFAYHLGITFDDKKNILVDKDFMTNINGIFAAGDVIGGLLQVSKAVSDGAHVAKAISKYLKLKK